MEFKLFGVIEDIMRKKERFLVTSEVSKFICKWERVKNYLFIFDAGTYSLIFVLVVFHPFPNALLQMKPKNL